jgi:hypothetical protein
MVGGLRLATPAPGHARRPPASPVWLSVPVAMLRSGENLPAGTRMFAHSLSEAESVTLAFAPEGQRMAAKLDVLCRNEIDAADAALELTRVTGVLRQMIARENQSPNPADLSGVLAAGSFRAAASGSTAIGPSNAASSKTSSAPNTRRSASVVWALRRPIRQTTTTVVRPNFGRDSIPLLAKFGIVTLPRSAIFEVYHVRVLLRILMRRVLLVPICLMAGWLALAADSPRPHSKTASPPRCRRFCATRTRNKTM